MHNIFTSNEHQAAIYMQAMISCISDKKIDMITIVWICVDGYHYFIQFSFSFFFFFFLFPFLSFSIHTIFVSITACRSHRYSMLWLMAVHVYCHWHQYSERLCSMRCWKISLFGFPSFFFFILILSICQMANESMNHCCGKRNASWKRYI